MKRKPKGARYRNLYAIGNVIYYERVLVDRTTEPEKVKRLRFSTKCSDWDEAAGVRDLYEARTGIGLGLFPREAPTFADCAKRYLVEDTGHLGNLCTSDVA